MPGASDPCATQSGFKALARFLLAEFIVRFAVHRKDSMKKSKTLTAWFNQSGAFKWANRPRFTETVFQSYLRSIGQLLLAWNDLHERLSMLSVAAMGGGLVNRPLALWHGAVRDKAKRDMLRVAIADMPENEKAGRSKLIDEIEWILDHANKLEGFRDDAAHTPLRYLFRGVVQDMSSAAVYPSTSFRNPRAIRLEQKGKDLVIEYQYARERLVVLRDYVIAIDAAWSNAHLPWPGRPALPERKPKKARQTQGARRKPK
jgi:hypothetical protein